MTPSTTNTAARELPEYSQGVCGDGAAILKDGVMLTIDEIVAELNGYATLTQQQGGEQEARDILADALNATSDYIDGMKPDAYVSKAVAFKAIQKALRSKQAAGEAVATDECGRPLTYWGGKAPPRHPANEEVVRNAERYLWLRNEAVMAASPHGEDGQMVWAVVGNDAYDVRPIELDELDAHIDAALAPAP